MVIYIAGALFVGFTAARIGLSYYYGVGDLQTVSDQDIAAAIYFDPANPAIYRTQAARALQEGDRSNAAVALQRAVQLSAHDHLLWLALGRVQTDLGRFDAARHAYQTAIALAPNYPQPNRYLGLMLLGEGSRDEAFTHLSKAARQDIALYPEIFEIAREQFPGDPIAMERAIDARTPKTRKIITRYFLEHNLITDGIKAFLTGEELKDPEKDCFVRILIKNDNIKLAHETWLTRRGFAAPKPTYDEPVFDGGFETLACSDYSGFGWQIEQKISYTAVTVDSKVFHKGSRSLQIKFAGNVEHGANLISQTVMVKPFQAYRLSFAVLSSELISGALPVIVVEGGKPLSLRAASAPIEATNGNWSTMTVDFKTRDEITVRIGVQRAGCTMSPCPIFGAVSLDDFSIKEIN